MKPHVPLLAAAFAILSVTTGPARAEHAVPAASVRAVAQLERSLDTPWVASWNPRTGALESVYGSRSQPLAMGAAGAPLAVRGYLLGHANLFHLRAGIDDLRHERTVEFKGIRHVHMQQTYRGLPILGAGYNVAVDSENRVVMVTASSQPELSGDVTATLSAAQAVRVACAPIVGGRVPEGSAPSLAVLVDDGVALPVYEVDIAGTAPSDAWHVVVNARTGAIVGRTSLLENANYAFLPTPGQPGPYPLAPGYPHGNNPQAVTLGHLNGAGTQLSGQYAEVHSDDGFDVPGVAGHFKAPTSDSLAFSQVHAYYWADGFLSYLHGLGYSDTTRLQIRTNVTDPYLGGAGTVFLSPPYCLFSRGFQNAAYDGNTVVHEAQHFVNYQLGFRSLTQPLGHTEEPGALQEGVAMYFASSYTGDPAWAVWVIDSLNPPDCGFAQPRTLDSNPSIINMANYNHLHVCGTFSADDHVNGLIVAGGIWDLRKRIIANSGTVAGSRTTDALALEAIAYLPPSPTMGCFFDALIQADVVTNGAANLMSIMIARAGRGLRCNPDAIVSGPEAAYVGQTATYTAIGALHDCGIYPWWPIAWQRRDHCSTGSCAPWSTYECDSSDTYITTEITPNAFDLRAIVMNSSSVRDTTPILLVHVWSPMTVTVNGPSSVNVTGCPSLLWTASVSSSRPPFTYRWTDNNVQASTAAQYTPPTLAAGSHVLVARVTDGDGQIVVSPSKVVAVTGFCDLGGDQLQLSQGLTITARNLPLGNVAEAVLTSPAVTPARLDICDVMGRRVSTPFEGELSPGSHSVSWSTSTLHSGVYFYRLWTPTKTLTHRFVLVH